MPRPPLSPELQAVYVKRGQEVERLKRLAQELHHAATMLSMAAVYHEDGAFHTRDDRLTTARTEAEAVTRELANYSWIVT